MVSHWKYFICNQNNIPDKFYTPKGQANRYHYDEIVYECLKLNQDLMDEYKILQELLRYYLYEDYDSALKFIDRIERKLESTMNELYVNVAKTYRKWRYQIANAFSKNQFNRRFTNAIAENNNTHIKRIIKTAYGYKNFERFRKKVLLNRTYKK